jgi:hypothetical protein
MNQSFYQMANNTTMTLFYILLLLCSCRGNRSHNQNTTDIGSQPDTVVFGERFILFGQDSAGCTLSDGSGRKIIYTATVHDNDIHYKIYDTVGILREIAYARHIPLAFDSVYYHGDIMYPYPDSVVQYYSSGTICKTGHVEYQAERYRYASFPVWVMENSYDSTGFLIEKITHISSDTFIYESYHRNGMTKEKGIQGYACGSGACLGFIECDSLGRKTKEHQYEYKVSETGTSHRRFEVETVTEYYADGKIKQIKKHKCFYECEGSPCGEWMYYNEKGEKIRTERHNPCCNFLIDCE